MSYEIVIAWSYINLPQSLVSSFSHGYFH